MAEKSELRKELKWMGQPARHILDLTLESVLNHLPIFERNEFGENEYLDVILRLPFGSDSRTIPVGSVSKRYFLVQHRELVERISEGLAVYCKKFVSESVKFSAGFRKWKSLVDQCIEL